MTSIRQIEANRKNALNSTGPVTTEGKARSRCNAVRHGLTAETVIGALEDAQDYQAFEATVTADYDAQTAVEREFVLRLASLLWRLRRATAMETGLFDTVAANEGECAPTPSDPTSSATVIAAKFRHSDRDLIERRRRLLNVAAHADDSAAAELLNDPARDLARTFLQVAGLPTFPLDRLSRYEATLWRQAGQILFTLEALRRRPNRNRRFPFDRRRI